MRFLFTVSKRGWINTQALEQIKLLRVVPIVHLFTKTKSWVTVVGHRRSAWPGLVLETRNNACINKWFCRTLVFLSLISRAQLSLSTFASGLFSREV
jgi:hypothetical protein